MKYDVTVSSPGGIDIVTVEADSGDEAAAKAHKRGTVVRGVIPSEDQGDKKPGKAAA